VLLQEKARLAGAAGPCSLAEQARPVPRPQRHPDQQVHLDRRAAAEPLRAVLAARERLLPGHRPALHDQSHLRDRRQARGVLPAEHHLDREHPQERLRRPQATQVRQTRKLEQGSFPSADPSPPNAGLRDGHLGQPAGRAGGQGRERPAGACRPDPALLARREGQLLRGDQEPRRRDEPQREARELSAAGALRESGLRAAGRTASALQVRAAEPVPLQLQRHGRAAGRLAAAAGQRRLRAPRLRAAQHRVRVRPGDLQRPRVQGHAQLGEGPAEDVAARAHDEPADHPHRGAADQHLSALRGPLGHLPADLQEHAAVHGVRQRPHHRQRERLVRRLADLHRQVAADPQRLHPDLADGLARDGQVLPGRRHRERRRHEVHLLRRHRSRSAELVAHRRARPDRLHLQRQDRHAHLQHHGLQEALRLRRSLRRALRHQGRPGLQDPAERLRARPQALRGARRPGPRAPTRAGPLARVPRPVPHGAGRRRRCDHEVLRSRR